MACFFLSMFAHFLIALSRENICPLPPFNHPRLNTLSKLTFSDCVRFDGLIRDVFCGVAFNTEGYQDLKEAVKASCNGGPCLNLPPFLEAALYNNELFLSPYFEVEP